MTVTPPAPSRRFPSTALLFALTLLAFAPALTGGVILDGDAYLTNNTHLPSPSRPPPLPGGFIWDDDDYVTNNPNLRSLSGLADIWISPRSSPQYYPLVHTSFWIEHQLWGLNPTGYHVVNVLLHATAAVLLWRVLAL